MEPNRSETSPILLTRECQNLLCQGASRSGKTHNKNRVAHVCGVQRRKSELLIMLWIFCMYSRPIYGRGQPWRCTMLAVAKNRAASDTLWLYQAHWRVQSQHERSSRRAFSSVDCAQVNAFLFIHALDQGQMPLNALLLGSNCSAFW